MTAVAVLPIEQLVIQLGRLELQQKSLGLINHAYGVRLAIAMIQAEAADAWHAVPPPAAPAAMQAMVDCLTAHQAAFLP